MADLASLMGACQGGLGGNGGGANIGGPGADGISELRQQWP